MIQSGTDGLKLEIHLQFRSKTPLSDQVRSAIFGLIQQGKLPEDTILPTVRQLAAQLGVNFNTVARAYRALDKEGWLITRQGRGTVVARPEGRPVEDPFETHFQKLTNEIQVAAVMLDLSEQEILVELEKRLILKSSAEVQRTPMHVSRRKKRRSFRSYEAAFPRSRKTKKETLDWRLRAPNAGKM